MSDSVAVLTCIDQTSRKTGRRFNASKIWTGTGEVISSNTGTWFSHEAIRVDSIHDLSRLLFSIEGDPYKFIIRGDLNHEIPPGFVMRRKKPREDGRIWFQEPEGKLSWAMFDFDKMPNVNGLSPVLDPRAVAAYFASLLPDYFDGVTYHWQMSSSAGMGDGSVLSGHLFYWFDRPVSDRELKAWRAQTRTPVDPALFDPVQPHYTAAPLFEGRPDPLRPGGRSGLWQGRAASVPFPAIDTRPVSAGGTAAGYDGGLSECRGFEAKLARLGDGDGLDGFHSPLTAAIASYAAAHGRAGTDAVALKARLRQAILEAPKAPGRRDDAGYMSDGYLDGAITSALAQFGDVRPGPPRFDPTTAGFDESLEFPVAPPVAEVRGLVSDAIGGFTTTAVAYGEAVKRYREQERARAHGLPPDPDDELPPPMPPVIGICACTGIGKSTILREQVDALLASAPDKCVVVLVPTLALADEAAAAMGAGAASVRGRGAKRPDGGGLMCCDPEAVDDAIETVEGVQRTVCKRGESLCQHFTTCRYQWQIAKARKASVIFMAHQHLFHAYPDFLKEMAALIIDEAFWQSGLDGGKRKIPIDALKRPWTVGEPHESARFNACNSMLAKALETDQCPLTRGTLSAVGITAEFADKMPTLWWRTKITSGILPGMSRLERAQLRQAVESTNKSVKLFVTVWEIVRDLLNGDRSSTAWINNGVLNCRRSIAKSWRAPTLVLDATLRDELVTPYLPTIQVISMPYPAAPHARTVQISGGPVAKHKLSVSSGSDKDKKTAENHLTDLARYIEIRAAQHETVLVVCQMEVEASLRALGLPANVELAHFNATRGIDRFKNVDYLLVIGRTLPGPREVESLAEALTGRPAARLTPPDDPKDRLWYPRSPGEWHPDPDAEACRWGICEAELVQTIGRARAINRTDATPVLVEVLNDVPLPLPVDAIEDWRVPRRSDLMAARGVILENCSDIARAFPDLWPNAKAVEDARRTPEFSYIELSSIGVFGTPHRYQPAGRGQKPRKALFDLELIPDPKTWLTERLGTLARFELLPEGVGQ